MSIANGHVDESFLELVRHVCHRPAMYVGTHDFEKACIFLDGYADGRTELAQLGRRDHLLHRHFQRFLVLKYGYVAARQRNEEVKREAEAARSRGEEPEFEPEEEPIHPLYGNIGWWSIIRLHFKGSTTDELLAKLLEDFEQFANPLSRMAFEVQ